MTAIEKVGRRANYRWNERQIGVPWLMVLSSEEAAAGFARSAHMAFLHWCRRDGSKRYSGQGRDRLALLIEPRRYSGPESGGKNAPAFLLTVLRQKYGAADKRSQIPDDWTPPADAMDSVRARRAERAALGAGKRSDVDRRRRYDWRPEHGHVVTVSRAGPEWRRVEAARQAWHAWKRSRIDAGAWTADEAHCWRIRLEATRSRLLATVIDVRLAPPDPRARALEIDEDDVPAAQTPPTAAETDDPTSPDYW